MENTILYRQNFVIDDRVFTGTVEKTEDDIYIVIYENDQEIKRKLYNGSINDEFTMISEMESFIED